MKCRAFEGRCINPSYCMLKHMCGVNDPACVDPDDVITVDLTPNREPLIVGVDDETNERITLDAIECPAIPGLDQDPGDEDQ